MNKSTHLLLADAEPEMLQILTEFFTPKGYVVDCAATGDQCLAALDKETDIEAVILDLRLPGLGGMELLSRISEMKPGLSVIVFSGLNDTNVARKAMEFGAFDYVVKPASLSHLETILIAGQNQGASQWVGHPLQPSFHSQTRASS